MYLPKSTNMLDHTGVEAEPESEEVKAEPESEEVFTTLASSNFEPMGPNMVQVQTGNKVQVLRRQPSGWMYCTNISTGGMGWAPSWVLQPHSQAGCTSESSAGDPSSIREE